MGAACTLTRLPRGCPAQVVAVDPTHAPRLGALGLRPGVVLSVEQDAPLGGPRIVRLGRARLAISREVARGILVRPEPCPEVRVR